MLVTPTAAAGTDARPLPVGTDARPVPVGATPRPVPVEVATGPVPDVPTGPVPVEPPVLAGPVVAPAAGARRPHSSQ
ncbi:hypothetical protein V1634_13550 [Plantactinospora veratri]|uniref:Uncharacterized protein n=1 Tax=Plantactinospora veratri TaxID=1436122 RepID=A0ABU7SD28_9ACTN